MSDHELPTRRLPGHAKRSGPNMRSAGLNAAAMAAIEATQEHAVAGIIGRDLTRVCGL